MDILTAILFIFFVSYVLARISHVQTREHNQKLLQEIEKRRKDRIDALYGRDETDWFMRHGWLVVRERLISVLKQGSIPWWRTKGNVMFDIRIGLLAAVLTAMLFYLRGLLAWGIFLFVLYYYLALGIMMLIRHHQKAHRRSGFVIIHGVNSMEKYVILNV